MRGLVPVLMATMLAIWGPGAALAWPGPPSRRQGDARQGQFGPQPAVQKAAPGPVHADGPAGIAQRQAVRRAPGQGIAQVEVPPCPAASGHTQVQRHTIRQPCAASQGDARRPQAAFALR